jgi:hypothetical protein
MRRWRAGRATYIDFWQNFAPNEFFLTALLAVIPGDKKLKIWSVYPNLIKRQLLKIPGFRFLINFRFLSPYTNIKKLWWTGENSRPPEEQPLDLFISFDQDSLNSRNVYFPLFYSELLFPNSDSKNRLGIPVPSLPSLLEKRDYSVRQDYACAFINNPEPTRLAAISNLGEFGRVDVFGAYSGKPVESKYTIAKNYKFVLCFENSLHPGYITEKLLDAYLCGAVPLYWGDLGNEPHINRQAFINARDFSNLEEFAHFVGDLSEEDYAKIHSQPLLNSLPSSETLVEALRNL